MAAGTAPPRTSEQYSEGTIPALEGSVRRQVAEGSYDFGANKALLKLYQLYPGRCDDEVLGMIFAKALAQRPCADLKALLYMCPEALMEGSALAKRVAHCDGLLDEGKFSEYWKDVRDVDAVVPVSPKTRDFVVGLLADTYQSVPMAFFADILGLDVAAASALAGGLDFVDVRGDLVFLTSTPENQPRQPGVGKAVGLDALLSLFDGDYAEKSKKKKKMTSTAAKAAAAASSPE